MQKGYYKIYDMSRQGFAKGTLIALVYAEKNGQQIGTSTYSRNIDEVHDSARRVAKDAGFPNPVYDQSKIEVM